MLRSLAALALAVVASTGLVVTGVTTANAETGLPMSASEKSDMLATTYCPYRANRDAPILSDPPPVDAPQVGWWLRGQLKFLAPGRVVENFREIAARRWVYVGYIYRDTSIACYHD